MTLRTPGRSVWFVWNLVVIITNYLLTAARAPKDQERIARAAWLSRSARRQLRVFNYSADVAGDIPKQGLLFCNHLSYLDILAISAVAPAVFVSKSEVRSWPMFGWFAVASGTVFVERARRLQVGEVNREVEAALAAGALVVIFPEGTSTDGKAMLPFRTSLLEPAVQGNHEIHVGWLHYELEPGDGDASAEVCYWGDHSFFPHAMNMLGKRSVQATLRFAKFNRTTDDRKELAKQLYAAVAGLKVK